jgi:hypothetical protein
MTGTATLILTTLGAGAAGSLITTYGTQTADRRAARAKARDCLTKAENLSKDRDATHEQITTAMDQLEISAMIARLPRRLIDLYRVARVRLWAARHATPPSGHTITDPAAATATRVGLEAGQLLSAAMWHPWLTAPYRWHRTRRLTRLLAAGMPDHALATNRTRWASRHWERETLRKAKQRKKR